MSYSRRGYPMNECNGFSIGLLSRWRMFQPSLCCLNTASVYITWILLLYWRCYTSFVFLWAVDGFSGVRICEIFVRWSWCHKINAGGILALLLPSDLLFIHNSFRASAFIVALIWNRFRSFSLRHQIKLHGYQDIG